MATTMVKHRDERRIYALDFADDLSDGETIASVDALTIYTSTGTDKTSEFRTGEPNPEISGTKVQFWLSAASGNEQAVATYRIECQITTSTGAKLVAMDAVNQLPALTVVDP